MIGDYEVMRTLVSHAGVAVVDTLEELLDLGELLIRWPSPPRGGAAVISDSGAFKAMVLDFCESSDLDLPEPSGCHQGPRSVRSRPTSSCRPIRSTSPRSRWSIPTSIARRCSLSSTTNATAAWSSPWCCAARPTASARWGRSSPRCRTSGRQAGGVRHDGRGQRGRARDRRRLRSLGVPFFRSPERALRALARLASLRAPQPASPARADRLAGDGCHRA